MPTPIRPKKKNGQRQNVYWIRKRVPDELRPLVRRTEVWRSLGTTDEREANRLCAIASGEIEAEWAQLKAEGDALANPPPSLEPSVLPTPGIRSLAPQDLHALKGQLHVRIRDAHIAEAGKTLATLRWATFGARADETQDDEVELIRSVRGFLEKENVVPTDAEVERFRPLFVEARLAAYADLARAAQGDYSDAPAVKAYPARTTAKIDLVEAFEAYVTHGGLKGGAEGPTAKRWRPKIAMFAKWLGHRDLGRMSTDDGYRWMDHLIAEGFARKSIRDVWLASLSATAAYTVERRKLSSNPFRGIKVRGVKDGKADEDKGFTPAQAKTILTATLAGRSHLISRETWAARRWVPWICAYAGSRVNEITSLAPADVERIDGIWCIMIKPELEKTEKHRKVPLHPHLIEQGFMAYVDERRKVGKPLFYDPARARGGKQANPQFQKVAERLAEWIHTLDIYGPAPNHAWRHLFKSVARHVGMNREIESFITGHSTGETSEVYGARWTKTLMQEISKYPRFNIKELKEPPTPHRRVRRSPEKIAADEAAKAARKGARATRAA